MKIKKEDLPVTMDPPGTIMLTRIKFFSSNYIILKICLLDLSNLNHKIVSLFVSPIKKQPQILM